MKARVLFTILVSLSLVCLAFAQPNDVTFSYYNSGGGEPALTGVDCFAGTPIPDGAAEVEVWLVGGGMLGSYPLNGSSTVGGPGYFYGLDYYLGAGASDYVYCVVSHEGVLYTSDDFGPVGSGGASVNFRILCPVYPADCDWRCEVIDEDTCDDGEPMEEGFLGPLDILEGETKSFIDTCTVRITAMGGDAHGVSVDVYDGVPQCKPVGFDYMSRVVAVYWDGSADEGTTLSVRMYYASYELDESGFDGISCLFAARFNDFACSWAPIAADDKTAKYVEFTTDRSGFFTFDCHGTTPRRIPLGSDPTIASGNNELVLSWQTVEEFETYRFHVLRAEGPEGPFAEVATIPSQLPDIKTTASYNYEYRDGGLENGHVYYYKLSREDLHGNQDDYPGIFSGVPSLNGDAVEIEDYCLHPAYPNPFNPETRISYDVLKAGQVDLRVFDILGREVALLVDDVKLKGRHNVVFNAKDLPSGLYFYRIDIGGQFTSTQKILLVK